MTQPSPPPTYLFVYGTLMTGYPHTHYLSSARCLGRALTQDAAFAMRVESVPFAMRVESVPFVARVQRGGVRIAGEVFAVTDPATLAQIDSFERHPDWCRQSPSLSVFL